MDAWYFQILAGAFVSIGFAIIYNTPKRLLKWSAIFGIIGLLVKLCVMDVFGFEIEFATFCGALTIGILAETHHLRSYEPRRALAVPPALQMIPGKVAFEAIVLWGVFWQNPNDYSALSAAIHMQLKTLLILILLVIGIATPTILFKNRIPLKRVFEAAHILKTKPQ